MHKLMLLFVVFWLAGTQSFAAGYEQTVRYAKDNILYDLNTTNHTAEVVGRTADLLYINFPVNIVYQDTEYTITSIAENAFSFCTSLQAVFIPDSVTYIGTKAFAGCSNMIEVFFRSNLCQANIADDAFEGMGSEYSPIDLFLPKTWDMFYLPDDAFTPWHGGHFASNIQFDAVEFRNKINNDIETEAAKVTDWSKIETIKINAYKTIINSEWDRYKIMDVKADALEYISLHKSRQNEVLGDMNMPCADCPVIVVSDGTTTVTLYNPQNVQFLKTQQEQ